MCLTASVNHKSQIISKITILSASPYYQKSQIISNRQITDPLIYTTSLHYIVHTLQFAETEPQPTDSKKTKGNRAIGVREYIHCTRILMWQPSFNLQVARRRCPSLVSSLRRGRRAGTRGVACRSEVQRWATE